MRILIIALILLIASISYGADVSLNWVSAQGATGYKIYMSTDIGATWVAPKDVGNVLTYIYVGVPDDKLTLFKISTYNAVGESITHWAGAWYDGRKKPPQFGQNLGIQ